MVVFEGGALRGAYVMSAEPPWMGLVLYESDHTELPSPFHGVQTQREDSHLQTRKQALTRHWLCLELGLLDSRTVRNTFLLFISLNIGWDSPYLLGFELAWDPSPFFLPYFFLLEWNVYPTPVHYILEAHCSFCFTAGEKFSLRKNYLKSHPYLI